MSTNLRVTAIPALVTTAAVTSLRGVFAPFAAPPVRVITEPALASLGLPRLTFTVTARRVRGVPLTVPAGRYQLTVVGDPPSEATPGGVMLIQLPEGMTLDDAMAAVEETRDVPPPFFSQSIMPGGAEIGVDGVSDTVIDLVPGEWIVAGYAMTTEPTTMTVTGEMPATLPEPRANATVTVGDMALELAGERLQRGENIIRIDNTGTQPHFVTIQQVPHGTTAANIGATLQMWAGQRPTARPVDVADIVHITSSVDQSGGTTMWLSIDLEPGTYAALGEIPDPTRHTPHALADMHAMFRVT